MRWIVALVALLGLLAATAALREHYRTEASPCSINEKWDCGIVNHSLYAIQGPVPVADIGIAGYFLLGVLALMRAWRTAFIAAVIGLAYSLYLTYIEAAKLQVWCIYCVISLSMISLITILTFVMALKSRKTSSGARSQQSEATS
ncbi:MAG TPA: vitamin K epoxide reductase family protein [Candidatus Angelobacter sp.]|nr:vitamin K epoxide reductase family protein [Candidatus Angelobacter sp.]